MKRPTRRHPRAGHHRCSGPLFQDVGGRFAAPSPLRADPAAPDVIASTLLEAHAEAARDRNPVARAKHVVAEDAHRRPAECARSFEIAVVHGDTEPLAANQVRVLDGDRQRDARLIFVDPLVVIVEAPTENLELLECIAAVSCEIAPSAMRAKLLVTTSSPLALP